MVVSVRWYLTVFLIACVSALPGCVSNMIATAFTDAPNGGRTELDTTRVGPAIYDHAGQVSVPGPPPVELAYWIMEPALAKIELLPADDVEQLPNDPPGWRYVDAKLRPEEGFYRIRRGPIEPDAALATVILLHGWDTQVRSTDYLWQVSATLAANGCRVILPDLRGHGDSTGTFVTSGFREVQDLSVLLNHLEENGKISGPIAVAGHSYGGGIAIQFAAFDPRVERLLAFSPLVDIRPVMLPGVRAFAKQKRPVAWFFYLQWVLNQSTIEKAQLKMQERTGADMAIHNAQYQISNIEVPALVLQGGQDLATPQAGAEKLREANPQKVELVIYPQAGHSSYFRDNFTDVKAHLEQWVNGLVEK